MLNLLQARLEELLLNENKSYVTSMNMHRKFCNRRTLVYYVFKLENGQLLNFSGPLNNALFYW